ncbi:GCN5-like protein 1 (GCN5L1) domain-containing protein [Hirsutella rhossiliensis]|uniref:Biogenesis of lysosome-related organelles complex 1 subunit 1 n=1 Tax=Hirsutella rhossiliensis TaxID=111463 RepID=A0A9P8N6X5_9HYPO|nr:GCN5-like protein 1 (GCN5L1) domain-containing protein [Hirsutella rhossiliensis]KAH0966899.1 GCN5-like protein 1 (GCN5L1) domain-containing protein [Hirsutella rhossiliensis]
MSSSASSTDPPAPGRFSSARQAAKPWASSSPPKCAAGVTTATASAQAVHAHPTTTTANTEPGQLQPTLPSAETQRQVGEARAAVVASMSNMLDAELQSRAAMLHEGAAGLERQEREVARATEALRREREKLAREADAAAKKVKELGNVQNWAEVLERGFLVLEETVRLANGGGDSGSGSCSCSECGREDDDEEEEDDDDGGGEDVMDLDKDEADGAQQGKAYGHDVEGGVDADGTRSASSGASRSLLEPDSSTGSGRAKGSETASLSTESLKDVDGRQLGEA